MYQTSELLHITIDEEFMIDRLGAFHNITIHNIYKYRFPYAFLMTK